MNKEEFKQQRMELKVNQSQLAELMGVSNVYVSLLEKGKKPMTKSIIGKFKKAKDEVQKLRNKRDILTESYRRAIKVLMPDFLLKKEEKKNISMYHANHEEF